MNKNGQLIGIDGSLFRVAISILFISIFSSFLLSLFGLTLSDLVGSSIDWLGATVEDIWGRVINIGEGTGGGGAGTD